MSTLPPKILFQLAIAPELLETYDLLLPAYEQPADFPKVFLDSLNIRARVFVDEQKAVPLRHHLDRDDARSCCMVLYSPEPDSQPIGTIRLVPSPHWPHPTPGARLEPPGDDVNYIPAKELFSTSLPEYAVDRVTELHDGIEPYVKLGRLSVLEEFRGKGLANLLVQGMLQWAAANPDFACEQDGIRWKGLVCIHAHDRAVGMWKRNGFVLDEGMGSWFEAGMRHVGMFQRLELGDVDERS